MKEYQLLKRSSIKLLPFFLSVSSAWGNLAHRTIALVAEKNFLLPATSDYVQSFLDNISLSDAAIWADTYKFLPEGRYTSSWHYLNTHDEPPRVCNLSYSYDLDHPSIIDAIVSMTRRVNDLNVEHQDRKTALMFLLHLIGDLHCPLHVEGLLRGGNDIPVLWEGKETDLHFVWDILIPQRVTNSTEEDEIIAALEWADKLHNQERDSNSARAKESWPVIFFDHTWDLLDDAESLALRWASEANLFVCQAVLKDGVDGVERKELSGNYYERSVPVLEYLVRNAGLRLAVLGHHPLRLAHLAHFTSHLVLARTIESCNQ